MATAPPSSAPSRWKRRLLIGSAALILVIVAAIGTVFAVTNSRMSETYDYEPAALMVEPGPALVERGKAVATFRGCRDCHGEDLAGRLVADAMPVMRLAGPNITPGGVTKDYTNEDWARAIRHGVRPDKTALRFMPSFEYTALSHADLAAIISYAKSVPAVSEAAPSFEVGPLGRVLYLAGELPLLPVEMIEHDLAPADPTPGPTAEYGQYLSSGCIGCHGKDLSGGPIPGVPPDWPHAPNLTPHDSGLESWTFEDFKTALQTGKTPSGHQLRNEYMPWELLSQTPERDLRAIWEYLRTVPATPMGG